MVVTHDFALSSIETNPGIEFEAARQAALQAMATEIGLKSKQLRRVGGSVCSSGTSHRPTHLSPASREVPVTPGTVEEKVDA
jgi:hypothetical protein